MRIAGALTCVLSLAILSGCSGDGKDSEPKDVAATTSATSRPSATTSRPAAQATYVPKADDPKEHTFVVTIRDQLTVPYSDAYQVAGDRCDALGVGSELVFEGPDKKYDRRPLKSFTIPDHARLVDSKTCEATMTVTVPYAPRYFVGVAMEGHGMPAPTDPDETRVRPKGDSQKLIVLR
ncbi:hypothetical protein ASE12_01560 [Aeromicrobium sp. Root236]|nr:hypothetical protein ASE12_01560 [Aeromicrobium sp. Root236]